VRGLLLLLLLAAAIIAGPDRLSRVAGALSLPRWPFAGPSVNAWITQPAYSGAPPLVLASGDHPMVLAGSRLTLVVDGKDQPRAALGDQAIRFGGSAQDGFRADADLRQSGKLQVGPWWHRLASWNITVVQPEKPVVHLTQLLPAAPLLLLRWNAQDRYGLVALNAAILPVGHPNALPETLSLALNSGNLQSAAGLAREDVSDSPYAGLQVQVVLSAANLAGVTAAAAPQTVRLPPPPLHDKTAAALADLRQRLALDPKARGPGQALQTLAQAPPTQISAAADVQMAMLARQISEHEISPEAAQQRMSTLGRQIEEGPDYEPAQALAAANQALEQALRQANNGRPLDNAKLQSLLAALHNALAQHLQALGPAAAAPGTPAINPGDLDRMAEQIAQDEAAGQTAKAAAELNRLQQILSALQSARPMSAAQAKRAQAAAQASQALSKLTQGEAALLDQTNQGNGQGSAQSQLQSQLGVTRQNLSKAGISLPGLSDAAHAMGQAQAALAQQDTGSALAAEGSAIHSLQKAAAALSAGQGMSFGEGESPGNGATQGEGMNGAPDEESLQGVLHSGPDPAGAIQQQIIKNDGNPALPATVHQYYHKLLNQN
jgi:hypothetical protein